MTLNDTVKLMLSEDWKEKMQGEHAQAKIRLRSLQGYIYKLTVSDPETVKPKCGMNLLIAQEIQMKNYIATLERRMKKEGIETIC